MVGGMSEEVGGGMSGYVKHVGVCKAFGVCKTCWGCMGEKADVPGYEPNASHPGGAGAGTGAGTGAGALQFRWD